MHPARYDIGVRCFLKYDKVVKTIVRWLRTVAKIYVYVVNLFKVEFEAMIVM